jgi:hypothetical protein
VCDHAIKLGEVATMIRRSIEDLERATKSVVLPLPDSATIEDGSLVQTPIVTTPRPMLDTKNANDTKESAQPATDHNMVLFVSLHLRMKHPIKR